MNFIRKYSIETEEIYGYSTIKVFDEEYNTTIFHALAFGNCQNFSCNSFKYFFLGYTSSKNFLEDLVTIFKYFTRPLLTVDLQFYIADRLAEVLEKHNIKYDRMNYTSSNRSEMCIMIIHLKTVMKSLEENTEIDLTLNEGVFI